MSSEKPGVATNFPIGDKLAFECTRLAYERTMMAWIRTSTALIAFGFGVYKFFEFMPFVTRMKPGEHVVSPRGFALVLALLVISRFCWRRFSIERTCWPCGRSA